VRNKEQIRIQSVSLATRKRYITI